MTLDPITVHRNQPLSEVYTLLQSKGFHHVPVVDGARPIGMISATDILKLVYDVESADDRMLRTMLDHQFTIEDAMTADIVKVSSTDGLRTVVDHMSTGTLHSVVVVDESGDLVGIVTSSDLIRQLGAML